MVNNKEEIVIKGLVELSNNMNDHICEGLQYCEIAKDALSLIREQRKQIGMLMMRNNPLLPCKGSYEAGHNNVMKCEVCCMCKAPVGRQWNYCPYCGQAVKWE